jgi:hypothetical protein
MIFACQTIMNHIAALHMNSGHRKVELGTATEAAMKVVNNLINTWDDAIASEWFTENMDLDRPRAERIADLQKLTSGKGAWKVVEGSITSPTKSFAKWNVESDGSALEIEMLMSPEKSPKIQKLTFKSASESKVS